MDFVVSTLNDSGQGSFRQALINANNTKKSTITFTVSGTIKLLKDLPKILSNVFINGKSAPNYKNTPVIIIDCNKHMGLIFSENSSGSRLIGLKIINSSSDG